MNKTQTQTRWPRGKRPVNTEAQVARTRRKYGNHRIHLSK